MEERTAEEALNNLIQVKTLMEKMSKNLGVDGKAVVKSMCKGSLLRDEGREAFLAGKYAKAAAKFKKSIELSDKGLGMGEDCSIFPTLIGLCESYIALKDWQNAQVATNRLMEYAKEDQFIECIRVAKELLDEIEQGKSGKPTDKESSVKPCSLCKAPDAKFRCSLCKSVNYCSKECQRGDWNKHKPICIVTATDNRRPSCGLCGFKGSRWILIDKTICCNQWICADQHMYWIGSTRLNSCMNNHMTFSKCKEQVVEKMSHFTGVPLFDSSSRRENRTPREIEWDDFVEKHFEFENITEAAKKRNREMKTDQSVALVAPTMPTPIG